jgi:ATP-dependent DNA helicase RecG
MPDFRVASILRDGVILEQAREAAFSLLERDGELASPEGKQIKAELIRRWGTRLELAGVA